MPKILLMQFHVGAPERRAEAEAFSAASEAEFAAVYPADAPLSASILDDVKGVIIGGSKYSVFEKIPNYGAAADFIRAAKEKELPIFGVCFGAQFLADVFGGKVERDDANKEIGTFDLTLNDAGAADPLFAGLPRTFPVQCYHHDRITELPPGATLLASTPLCPNHVFVFPKTRVYGVQFHPERTKAVFEKLWAMRGRKEPLTLRESPEALSLIAGFISLTGN